MPNQTSRPSWWQTNHSERPFPFYTYPLGTTWPLRKKKIGTTKVEWALTQGRSCQPDSEGGRTPGVREQEFKLLCWFCRCSYLKFISYTRCQSGEKGHRGHSLYSPFRRGSARNWDQKSFSFLAHRRNENRKKRKLGAREGEG